MRHGYKRQINELFFEEHGTLLPDRIYPELRVPGFDPPELPDCEQRVRTR